MALKLSTGLRNGVLDQGSLRSLLNLGKINVYAGTVPSSADASIDTATLLCTITNNSTVTGLTFETFASSGVLAKKTTETWSGVNISTGIASFFRFVLDGDTASYSTTEIRIQGTVGTSGSDMNMTSNALSSSATQTVDYFYINLPTL